MPIQAILLAAGVGRRLASLEQASPKCLLRFEGISLLHRHMRILEDAGISELLVVVGHLDHMIREEVAAYTGALRVSFAFNEHYRKGSIISLRTGLAHRGCSRSSSTPSSATGSSWTRAPSRAVRR
jgi:choline kinase